MPDLDLAYLIGLEPDKAVDYLRNKGVSITWDWTDQWNEAHAKAFTVAKATSQGVLQDIREAVDSAVATGRTAREFARELEPLLRKKGWWGRQQVSDPKTGEQRMVQLGSPWRLENIYRTNTMSAYNAGRLQAQREQAQERPWLQYLAVMDSRTRPSHAALHEKVFAADDPVWDTIYPPNGYGCRCRVRALTAEDLDARGLTPAQGGHIKTEELPQGRLAEPRPVSTWIGPNGERARIDPGFAHAPRQWPRFSPGGGMDDCLDGSFSHGDCRKVRVRPGQRSWQELGRPDLRSVPKGERLSDPGVVDRAHDQTSARELLRQALGLQPGQTREVASPLGPVYLREELLQHMVEKRTDARERYAKYVLPTLESPYEIWLTEYEDGGFRERYIGLFDAPNDLLAVVLRNPDGTLLWNVMQAKDKDMNKQRVGTLLWTKE